MNLEHFIFSGRVTPAGMRMSCRLKVKLERRLVLILQDSSSLLMPCMHFGSVGGEGGNMGKGHEI